MMTQRPSDLTICRLLAALVEHTGDPVLIVKLLMDVVDGYIEELCRNGRTEEAKSLAKALAFEPPLERKDLN